MNIGVIVYSETGNTLSVASKIKEGLASLNHQVELIELKNVSPNKTQPKLELIPNIDTHDGLVLGSFVEGFQLSRVFKLFLEEVSSLENKKIVCFVTQFFPFRWMGAKQTLKKMKNMCELKGATPYCAGVVQWSRKSSRKKQISTLVDLIHHYFEV